MNCNHHHHLDPTPANRAINDPGHDLTDDDENQQLPTSMTTMNGNHHHHLNPMLANRATQRRRRINDKAGGNDSQEKRGEGWGERGGAGKEQRGGTGQEPRGGAQQEPRVGARQEQQGGVGQVMTSRTQCRRINNEEGGNDAEEGRNAVKEEGNQERGGGQE